MANTHSIDLDGSSQYLSRADNASLSLTGDLTFECWFKPTAQPDSGANHDLISKWGASGNFSWIWGYTDDTGSDPSIRLVVSDDGSALTSKVTAITRLDNGTWYHLAIVYDASAGTAIPYIDTVAQTTQTSHKTSIYDGTADFTIGARINAGTANNFNDGLIDDVRVWSDVRTPTEISDNWQKEIVGDEAGLVSYWKLNNALTDENANANTLTNNNSATFSTDIPVWQTSAVKDVIGSGIIPTAR